MAESAFDFNNAPSGNMRQFGVLAGALGIKGSKLRSSGGNSMSARDQASLSAQTHAQNLELASHKAGLDRMNDTYGVAARHVVGEEAAASAHKRTIAQNRQAHKIGEAAAESAHTRQMITAGQTQTHAMQTLGATQGHEMNMANLHHANALNAVNELKDVSNVASFKSPSGASVQFSGVGEA
jgi:hypothetical protein